MPDTFTVSFFGHRQLGSAFRVEAELEKIICRLLREKEYVEFLVGRDGAFDLLAASTIKRCRRGMGNWNSSLVWVLPYLTAALRDNEDAFLRYYDEIEICDAAAAAHFKSAMQIRNRSMVDRSHLVIFCVEQKSGGAYQTMQYAKRVQKPCVNLWEQIHHSEHADWE